MINNYASKVMALKAVAKRITNALQVMS